VTSATEVVPRPRSEVVPRAATISRQRRRRLRRIAWNVVGLAVFAVLVFPVFWMISTAFKPDTEINAFSPTWFSAHPTLQHYRDAIARPYFWDVVKNSLIVVGAVVALSMVVAFLAAVALAKYRFSGNKLFVVLVIGILMLPQAGLVIPLYVVLAKYHLTNHLLGLVFTHLVILLPFAVWTLRGFVATSVFVFITSWNEYIFANVILTDQQNQTLTVWLSYFYGTSRETDWGGLMAASTLTAIPVVIFFLLVQRKIAFGLTAGAVKA
jgi:N,N'-diacetylchitobiose transport system permease protein